MLIEFTICFITYRLEQEPHDDYMAALKKVRKPLEEYGYRHTLTNPLNYYPLMHSRYTNILRLKVLWNHFADLSTRVPRAFQKRRDTCYCVYGCLLESNWVWKHRDRCHPKCNPD